jgi:hypothetical protein
MESRKPELDRYELVAGARGYIPCWPFAFELIDGEWVCSMNSLTFFIWETFLLPFWNGEMKVHNKYFRKITSKDEE